MANKKDIDGDFVPAAPSTTSRPQNPNVRPLKYTSFSVIGYLNGKNMTTSYNKADSHSHWATRKPEEAYQQERAKRRKCLAGMDAADDGPLLNVIDPQTTAPVKPPPPAPIKSNYDTQNTDPLYKTIIIHPGSRWLRIGRASDPFPVSVPNAIAVRSSKTTTQDTTPITPDSLMPPTNQKSGQPLEAEGNRNGEKENGMEVDHESEEDEPKRSDDLPNDPLSAKIFSLRGDLRARMRLFKLRGQGSGPAQAKEFNSQVKPEVLLAYDDPDELEWVDPTSPDAESFYVGYDAHSIWDHNNCGYLLRYPFDRGMFNTVDYSSQQEFLSDIERIWLHVLKQHFGIFPYELQEYSVILLIPDLYDTIYVRELMNLLLTTIGFKQATVYQEGLCASFGAGLSTCCVVDIGARKTSISCMEEGFILPETRMVQNFGGDDITEFLFTLLARTGLPYRDADLRRVYDFNLVESLKERMIVLSEGDVGLNVYDFVVRRPTKPSLKYSVKVYDDMILAPYALFAPRVVNFESKGMPGQHLWSTEVEDVLETGGNALTNAMRNSVKQLIPIAQITQNPEDKDGNMTPNGTVQSEPPISTFDTRTEASKLPLDVAIVESIMAAGAEERMRKLSANILIVGGTGIVHNVGFAVFSRVGPQLSSRLKSLDGHTTIVPTPQDIDPRIIAWKGICALHRLESSSDLWVMRDEWQEMGMRVLKERVACFM